MKYGRVLDLIFLTALLAVLIPSGRCATPATASQEDSREFIVYFPALLEKYNGDAAGIYSNNWPTTGHDMARTGYNAGEKVLYPPLEVVWTTTVSCCGAGAIMGAR